MVKGGWGGGAFGGVWGEGGVKNFFPCPNELLNWAHLENLVNIGIMVQELVKMGRSIREAVGEEGGEGWKGGKKIYPYPNEFLN